VELLVVLAILGLLVTMAAPQVMKYLGRAKNRRGAHPDQEHRYLAEAVLDRRRLLSNAAGRAYRAGREYGQRGELARSLH